MKGEKSCRSDPSTGGSMASYGPLALAPPWSRAAPRARAFTAASRRFHSSTHAPTHAPTGSQGQRVDSGGWCEAGSFAGSRRAVPNTGSMVSTSSRFRDDCTKSGSVRSLSGRRLGPEDESYNHSAESALLPLRVHAVGLVVGSLPAPIDSGRPRPRRRMCCGLPSADACDGDGRSWLHRLTCGPSAPFGGR
jgi:hypothetical protein